MQASISRLLLVAVTVLAASTAFAMAGSDYQLVDTSALPSTSLSRVAHAPRSTSPTQTAPAFTTSRIASTRRWTSSTAQPIKSPLRLPFLPTGTCGSFRADEKASSPAANQ